MHCSLLNEWLEPTLNEFALPPLPSEIIDSQGLPVDVSGDIWDFNDAINGLTFDFSKRDLRNAWLEYALKRYSIHSLRKVSPQENYNILRLNTLYLSEAPSWHALQTAKDIASHQSLLKLVVKETLENLRRNETLHQFARIRAWYSWCTGYLSNLGFDEDFAYDLEIIRIPGNEKGVAVRTDSEDGGPLNEAEQVLLRHALLQDSSQDYEHVKQRVALWLCLSFGRNPANLIQLREEDLKPIDPDLAPEEHGAILRIPRIKKRGRVRTQFKDEFITPVLLAQLRTLIEFNQKHHTALAAGIARPLFFREVPREGASTSLKEWGWHLHSKDFTQMIQRAVKRYRLISPRTRQPLRITTRRLRYTYATNRVKEGVSTINLAEALDHSDLQNVQVYFDAKSSIVERLDAAAAKEIAPILKLFNGTLISNTAEASNGDLLPKRIRPAPEMRPALSAIQHLGVCSKKEICTLYPPYSCCLCDRYQPFTDSLDLHEQMLTHLLDRRESLRCDPLGMDRIAVQLDEIIYACAQIVQTISSHSNA